jgi:hypothetical protein
MVGRAALLRRRGRAAARPYLEMRLHLLLKCSNGAYSNLRGEEPRKNSDEYRGFHIDYREIRDDPNFKTLQAAMNRQIDIVLAVGVPDKMLSFFRTVQVSAGVMQVSVLTICTFSIDGGWRGGQFGAFPTCSRKKSANSED